MNWIISSLLLLLSVVVVVVVEEDVVLLFAVIIMTLRMKKNFIRKVHTINIEMRIVHWDTSKTKYGREKSTVVYWVSTILPCLILSGWLMMNGMPADDLYNTPLFLMTWTPNVSPWSAVKTMIVLSNVHVSSSSLRNFISFPTLRSISLTIPK